MRSVNTAVTGKRIYALYMQSRHLERKDNVRPDPQKMLLKKVSRDYFKCILLFIYKGHYQIHEKWLLIWSGLPSSILLVTDILVKDTKKTNISLL